MSENKIIGRVKERFNELTRYNWNWKSFYIGWIEGRVDILKDKTIKTIEWKEYSWDNEESHPKKPGIKYLIHRKDGKVHWETWNGTNWAYNGAVITHYAIINKPKPYLLRQCLIFLCY